MAVQLRGAEHRLLKQQIEQRYGILGARNADDFSLRALVKSNDAPRLSRVLPGLLCYRLQEEVNPPVPGFRMAGAQHPQLRSVGILVFLKVSRKIEHRTVEQFSFEQEKRNENAPEAAVTHPGTDG
ncbi:MAG TPA: hypothetical protein VKX39_10855 [Bryobacteraceae bacterium]|nr:hypothetical protein [Bryobacteraceae bacterium]